MPAMVMGIFSSTGRIARHGRAEEQQVIEIGQLALGAKPPDFINALVGRAMNFGEYLQGKSC
jgi:hypothetical protein